MSRGFTLIEALLGLAVLSMVSLTTAGLLKAGIISSNHGLRYAFELASARKAFDGDGELKGMLWAIRESSSVATTDAAKLALLPAMAYSLCGAALCQAKAEQAPEVDALELHYYGLDEKGRVQEASDKVKTSFVTAQIAVHRPSGKPRAFLAGGRLLNSP